MVTGTPTPKSDLAFHAIGDGVRRAILEQLRAGEQSAGEIAAAFEVSWPAVSRHLRILKEAGLVLERRDGRQRRYSVNRIAIRESVASWAATFDAMWAKNLQSLKQLAEEDQRQRGEP